MNPNITTLLQEIKAKTGWSEPRIGVEVGVSQPTIHRILNGQSDCKGATLVAIVKLHESTVLSWEGKGLVAASGRKTSIAPSLGIDESNKESRREADLSYRQPADPKKVNG